MQAQSLEGIAHQSPTPPLPALRQILEPEHLSWSGGPAAVLVGAAVVPRRYTGAEVTVRLGVMRYRLGLGSSGGRGHDGARPAKP